MQNLRDENDEICEKGTITYLGSGNLVFVAFGTATNALRDYCYGILCLLVSIRRAKPNTQLRGGDLVKGFGCITNALSLSDLPNFTDIYLSVFAA